MDEISSELFKVLVEISASLICALMLLFFFFTLQYFAKFDKKSFHFIKVPWHPLLLYI